MSIFNNPTPQILDNNGDPSPGAQLFFFETGTSTLKTIYSDSSFTTAQSNPVITDANGRLTSEVYLDGVYRVVGKTAAGVNIDGWDKDPIGSVDTGPLDAWSSDATYNIPDIVKGSDDEYYRSITDVNQGNDPTTSSANWELLRFGRVWNAAVTYAAGDIAFGSDDRIYTSLIDTNLNNDPVSSPLSWAIGDVFNSILTKAAPYTVEEKDRGAIISVTGTTTITLLPVATAGRGFPLTVYNAGAAIVTVDGDGTETVNGSLTQTLDPGDSLTLTTSGATGWDGVRGLNPDAARTLAGVKVFTDKPEARVTGSSGTITEALRASVTQAGAGAGPKYTFYSNTTDVQGWIETVRINSNTADMALYVPNAGAPAKALNLQADGDVQAVIGNFVVGTDGKGVDFSITGDGGGTLASELLDDYEEGSWTPTVGGTATYTTQDGQYTKVGNKVTLWGEIEINVIGTGSATLISGLPYTASSGPAASGAVGFFGSISLAATWLTILGTPSGVTATTYGQTSADATTAVHTTFANSARVIFTLTYEV